MSFYVLFVGRLVPALGILAGAHLIILLEDFAEILHVVETGHFGYFRDVVLLFPEQFGGTLQADDADVVGRRLVGQCFQLVVEAGAAHVHQGTEAVHVEFTFLDVVFHVAGHGGDELPVEVVRTIVAGRFGLFVVYGEVCILAPQQASVL